MIKLNFKLFTLLLFALFSINCVSAIDIDVYIPEKYMETSAGERFYFEIEIKYPENPTRKDIGLTYEILDEEGNLIAQSKILKAIESQASFIDFIVIPESTDEGTYTIEVQIKDYELIQEDASASFHIKSTKDHVQMYFFILLGTVILVGLLVAFNILKKK